MSYDSQSSCLAQFLGCSAKNYRTSSHTEVRRQISKFGEDNKLQFVEQITEDKGATQRQSFKAMQKDPLEYWTDYS